MQFETQMKAFYSTPHTRRGEERPTPKTTLVDDRVAAAAELIRVHLSEFRA